MSLSVQFLDEIRSRTTLSALVGRDVKLAKAGREHKGCCPFHAEKTPSFYVNDEKAFYHCFSCQAHGDAIRWLIDARGLGFIDAVRELAAGAGIEMPARSAGDARREEELAGVAETIERAAAWYREQLAGGAKAQTALAARGIGAEAIARFGIGFAPSKRSVAGCGAVPEALAAAGLLIAAEGQAEGLWYDRFRGRITIPIHDARGRAVGFAGRLLDPSSSSPGGSNTSARSPKYINSPDSGHFDKGDLLFNLHRAAPAARSNRRLLIVEGQLDAVAVDAAGIEEVAAPMGTALTERQLERAWRAAHCPILLFDGDAAGRKAAMRACERALPLVGPGRSLAVALLPEGEDPDSLIRASETIERGRERIEQAAAAARPLAAFVWEAALAEAEPDSPEGRAALWVRLAGLAETVRDAETRSQYGAEWRARFDRSFPPLPPGLTEADMVPDGRVTDPFGLGEEERARIESMTAAWIERSAADAAISPKQAGRWAWDLGRRAAAGLVDPEHGEDAIAAVRRELAEAHPGADPDDFDRSFEIGFARGFNVGPLLTDLRCAGFARTDMGNAERWRERWGQDYLYTTAKGWLGWDGRRYRVLNQEKDVTPAEVLGSVFETVRAIQREGHAVRDSGWPEDEDLDEDLFDDDPRRPGGMDVLIRGGKKAERLSAKLAAWGVASESSGRIGCIANLAKRWVTVELTDFDTDPMLLNCMNGTLRFHRAEPGSEAGPGSSARVELRPHDRADRLTKIAACAYDPEAAAPHFQKLVRWAQPQKERRRYLRQWLGYNLTGDVGEQIFHIWFGPLAANGKSTVGNACRDAIGDYGDAGKVETFLDTGAQKGGDAATPALVRLPGVRFLTAGEPKSGVAINEALINSLTGGDQLLARDNFRSFFRFLPTFKFTLWCNELPPIPRGTAGIWRRVKVMPWEQHLEEHERDRGLPDKLAAEYAGILAWMVRGLVDWMEHGFVEPESVQLASADYKQDSDPISSFLRTCTAPDPEGRVQSSHLYELFCAWAKAAGETEWKQKGFSQALKAKGLASKTSNGVHWLGLRTTREPFDFVDSEGRVRNLDALVEGAADSRPAEPPPPYPSQQEIGDAYDEP
jgi:DNA primase catalytic core